MSAEMTKVLEIPQAALLVEPTKVAHGVEIDGGDELGPLPPELLCPNVDHLITEDDTPVDNFYSEKQGKFSTHILHATPHPFGAGRSFIAVANVGLYNTPEPNPIVPDVMVSLDVSLPENIWEKRKRSYFIWEFGKTPEVVMEIVSNKIGGEEDEKLKRYVQMRIPYYVIYDPEQQLSDQLVRIYELQGAAYVQRTDHWLPSIGLGLVLWHGRFEDRIDTWLRWCDRDSNLLLTGEEQTEQERQRAEQAEEKTARLLAQLRALGVEPD